MKEEEGKERKKRPLHVLLCPLITRLSLKQMADHRPVYIYTCSFERGVQKLGLASLEIHKSQIIEIKGSSILIKAGVLKRKLNHLPSPHNIHVYSQVLSMSETVYIAYKG